MSRSGDRTSTFDPSHSDNLLHGLNLLWRKQLFCDVTLTAQGQQFHCHKAVLASCSQYFRSLFSSHPPLGGGVGGQDGLGAPKDQQQPQPQPPPQQQPPPPQDEPGTPSSSPDDKLLTSPRAINNLVLQGCSSIGLRLVLEYLYTANVTLSLDTVEEVLSVSKILHIPQVTKLCVQFLNDQISVQNYKQVCKIAALHGLEETKKLANKYLVEDVLLLNFEEMRALLDSLPPPVESELALFQMSVLWLEHDRETRMQYAPDLMKRLRFALIPAPELVERVQSVDFMRTDPVCQKLLLDAMNYHLMPFRQHCRQSLASRASRCLSGAQLPVRLRLPARVGKLHLRGTLNFLSAQLGRVWRLTDWRLQTSELKNYSRFHFPDLCAFSMATPAVTLQLERASLKGGWLQRLRMAPGLPQEKHLPRVRVRGNPELCFMKLDSEAQVIWEDDEYPEPEFSALFCAHVFSCIISSAADTKVSPVPSRGRSEAGGSGGKRNHIVSRIRESQKGCVPKP
ncbi:Kelch-like protein 14 [Galemys pyrenaicus]|uniref:Kelch-like protein 14 n=1 Tax=Galemys pyrenaicus TaxID=202257 RepID=A0A8J6AM53_GALPY|nr:Kelch-like protein 14 [Galemys pyrenaicus]